MKTKVVGRRRLPVVMICLLILVTTPIALLIALPMVRESSFCAIPTEVSFSQEFLQSLLKCEHSGVDLVELVYEEVSRHLAWHGTVDFVGYYTFEYVCQSDSCDLEEASILTPVHHYRLCTYDRRVRGTIVVVDIDISESRTQVDLYGSEWISTSGPVWDEISLDIASIKKYAVNSIPSKIWDMHHSLVLRIGKIPGGWGVTLRTIDGREIRWEEVEYSTYQHIKEDLQ